MIAGAVNASYEAVIPVAVQGPEGEAREIEAVVDTAFAGILSLPASLVAELGPLSMRTSEATFADGMGLNPFCPLSKGSGRRNAP